MQNSLVRLQNSLVFYIQNDTDDELQYRIACSVITNILFDILLRIRYKYIEELDRIELI